MHQHNKASGQEQDEGTKISANSLSWELPNDLDKYEHLRITPATDIPPPVAIISINGETISTEGNITTISGASKSGKSAFTSWIIAGAISKTGIINDPLEGLEIATNPAGKALLHFDTEQARHKQQANIKSNLRRAGLEICPDYYLSYNLRQLDLNEYGSTTANICEHACRKFKGIHLIVVDGIADYIGDVNEASESNAIVKFFEEIAVRYATPVVVIVHTNPGNDKERGHLGSQCQRKSESVLVIKQENDISYLEPKFLRNAGKGDIPNMQFKYDKIKGYHVGCGVRVGETSDKEAMRQGIIKKLLKTAFAPPGAYKYDTAIDRIMKEIKKSASIAKGFFREMKVYELIVQGEDKYWRCNVDKIQEYKSV